jgi:hypothetical protein
MKFPKRARSTVFYIPNTPEGRAWLKQSRLYLNRKHWKLRPRGRGPRRSQGANKEFLALPLADYFGLYVWSPSAERERDDDLRKLYQRIQWLEAEERRYKSITTSEERLELAMFGRKQLKPLPDKLLKRLRAIALEEQ